MNIRIKNYMIKTHLNYIKSYNVEMNIRMKTMNYKYKYMNKYN